MIIAGTADTDPRIYYDEGTETWRMVNVAEGSLLTVADATNVNRRAPVVTGTVDPTIVTPGMAGEIYVNTTSHDAWVAYGTGIGEYTKIS